MFHVKRPDDKEKVFHNNPAYMLPNEYEHGRALGLEYQKKSFCQMVSEACGLNYKELYEDTPESDVYELLALHNKNNYWE